MAESNNPPTDPARDSTVSSPRSSTDSRSPSSQNSSAFKLNSLPGAATQNRQSFSDALRVAPASPRARRQPSFTQAAVQSLIDNPPSRNPSDPAFSGRDWTQISIGELTSPNDLKWVEIDTGIEEATNILIESDVAVLLVRESPEDKTAICTFDFTDLNAYLLLVVGVVQPPEEFVSYLRELGRKAREGIKIPLGEVMRLWTKQPLTTLPPSANLMKAVETFGGGVHRVIVTEEDTSEVVGIFSQWRLVKFLWENGQSFPVIEQLYPQYLRDLGLGSHRVISINGDRPLCHALELMHTEGISSVAVVDNQSNVVGNISVVDVKLLTKSTSFPLLQNTCIHFISVILSTRGLTEGKDSFPVFHVTPQSTLAHTVAKLVATKSHRMWVTDPHSPSSSTPSTPSHTAVHIPLSSPNLHPGTASQPVGSAPQPPLSPPPLGLGPSNNRAASQPTPAPPSAQPHLPTPPGAQPYGPNVYPQPFSTAVPASSLPGSRLSGRLVGVVSLTDILYAYARASGLNPADPTTFRSQRRRSSSSSLGVRRSGDFAREIRNRPVPAP
ncbi:hypothetical protein VTO42DRAFT_3160 [Malbranchea cinnamomea]